MGSELEVRETAFRLHNGESNIIKEPKTPHSRRRVSLTPSLVLLLKKYREDQELISEKMGKKLSEDDFVFCHPDGRPLDPDSVIRRFSEIVRNARIPRIRLHDLRHTHATLMLKAGVHPKVVSERLGHAGIALTLDTIVTYCLGYRRLLQKGLIECWKKSRLTVVKTAMLAKCLQVILRLSVSRTGVEPVTC